jgi:hypothetical protein
MKIRLLIFTILASIISLNAQTEEKPEKKKLNFEEKVISLYISQGLKEFNFGTPTFLGIQLRPIDHLFLGGGFNVSNRHDIDKSLVDGLDPNLSLYHNKRHNYPVNTFELKANYIFTNGFFVGIFFNFNYTQSLFIGNITDHYLIVDNNGNPILTPIGSQQFEIRNEKQVIELFNKYSARGIELGYTYPIIKNFHIEANYRLQRYKNTYSKHTKTESEIPKLSEGRFEISEYKNTGIHHYFSISLRYFL